MPIDFQPMTFEQANPVQAALGNAIRQHLEEQYAKQSEIQNQYLPDQLKIANALKQNELNFAPQMSQATLAEKQQMAPYYHALTGEASARIPYIQQQTQQILQQIHNPNLGSEGALGTIAYGKWLQGNQPQQQQIPQSAAPQEKVSNLASILSLLNQPESQQQAQAQPQQRGVPFANVPTAPGAQTNQPSSPQNDIAQTLIKSGLQQSQAKSQQLGGGRGGVGTREQLFFQSLVAQDNPHLQSPEQIYEASNVLASGGDTLSDGTKLNPISPAAKASLDRLTKAGTTAALATQSVKANQASAELDAMEPMISADFKPYADTYSGYSPQQIADSFKNDKASQERLGNFVASQAGQYELAQIRNRIAQGEPGITATTELMNKSGQVIDTMFPKLSGAARAQASKRLNEYLREGLKARNAQGINISQTRTNEQKAQQPSQAASQELPKANAPEGTTKKIGNKTYHVVNGVWHE